METKSNLAKAILAVMNEVKGIEKSMEVGIGSSAYKGVPDKEVKKIIGVAMQKHGLCIIPIGIEESTEVSRWEETYNGVPKQKQSVFTKVKTKYCLLHESGESIELAGLGHGVDSQDKGAGKATTYALKYALLYLFLTPTGKIDDSDSNHSDEAPVPPKQKIELPATGSQFQQAVKYLRDGGTLEMIEINYTLTEKVKQALMDAVNQ